MREPSPDSVWRERDFVRYWAGQIMALAPRAGAIRVLIAGQAILGAGIALFNLQSLSLRQAITPAGCSGASTRWCAWSAGEPSRSVRLSAAGSAG